MGLHPGTAAGQVADAGGFARLGPLTAGKRRILVFYWKSLEKGRASWPAFSHFLIVPDLDPKDDMSSVTQILEAIDRGHPSAAAGLLPMVYDELRKIADQRLRDERAGQTLQPTALVHEAFLRLVDQAHADRWNSRGHFFAAASEAMRRILVDRARAKATTKRGGQMNRVSLPVDAVAKEEDFAQILAIDEALAELQRHEPSAAQLVKLRYFAGMSHKEAADVLGISRGAADRLWRLSRAWLFRELQ